MPAVKKILFICIIFILSTNASLAIARRAAPPTGTTSSSPTSASDANISSPVSSPEIHKILEHAGRVSWSKGGGNNLIAFDRTTDNTTKNTDVFVMNPDGSGEKCITCNSALRKGFIGQPSWAPDGKYLLVQVENENSQHRFYNHPAWGIDNDLYLISGDGAEAVKLYSPARFGSVLHPHFNKAGTMVIWAERIPTGKSRPLWKKITPNGKNHWDGWQIHIASFNNKTKTLSNHRTIKPNGNGVYETHGFSTDGRIVYSHTANGQPYVDDVYLVGLNGRNPVNLTKSPQTWDEHGIYAPDGSGMSFMSSRVDTSIIFPAAKAKDLVSELYLLDKNGQISQLTNMNERLQGKAVVSDYDWDRTGKHIVFQVARLDGSAEPELWLLTFPDKP